MRAKPNKKQEPFVIEIQTEDDSDVSAVVCRPVGLLDVEAAAVLGQHVSKLLKSTREVVIDLGRVNSVDSDAVILLLASLRRARVSGGATLIANPRGQVRRHLQLIGAYPALFGDRGDEPA